MLSLNPGFNFATGPFAQGLQPSMLPLYSPVNDFDLLDNEIMTSQEMPYFYQQQQQQVFEQGMSLNSYPYRLSNDLYYQNQFRDVNNSMYSTKPIYHQHVRPSYPTRQEMVTPPTVVASDVSVTSSRLLSTSPYLYQPYGSRRASINTCRSASPTGESSPGSSSKRYVCHLCSKRFTRPSSLTTHIYSHTGEKPFKCPVGECGRQFSVVSNLRRHAKIHNNNNNNR
ncbi:Putative C2H2 conidiation transcription factor FlbC [Rhizopus microsporus]|nr:Putative C2H2 conidiation transcription factor FlbC [Rhizopus microsporus]